MCVVARRLERAAGKHREGEHRGDMVALVAAMRKLLLILNALPLTSDTVAPSSRLRKNSE